jgi:hypothetical protein
MIKVKFFEYENLSHLEKKVNEFLEQIENTKFREIKLNTITINGSTKLYFTCALVYEVVPPKSQQHDYSSEPIHEQS